MLHATPTWSQAHVDREPETLAAPLLAAWDEATGRTLPVPIYRSVHRWRFARAPTALGAPCLHAADRGLGVCGDWCPGARIEGAFSSGVALADRLIEAG